MKNGNVKFLVFKISKDLFYSKLNKLCYYFYKFNQTLNKKKMNKINM